MKARCLFVAAMGSLMGLAGIEHGVGEFLQGSVAPAGVMIQSWPDSEFFRSLGGEPAMTILPNLRLTGVLALVFSLLFTAWAIFFAQRRRGGLVLMLLAVPMMLFGSGIFPPVLGMLIGAAAAAPRSLPSSRPVSGIQRLLGRGWGWIFALCCAAWLALFPGVAVMSYFFGFEETGVTLAVMAAAFTLLFLAHWSSVLHEMQGTLPIKSV